MMLSPPMPPQAELDADIGYRLITTAAFFLALETICVALRIASRRLTRTSVGADDVLIIPAFILCTSVPGVGIAMVKYGGCGRHAGALAYEDPAKLVQLSKLIVVLTCVYVWSAALPKLVILALYLRIFTVPIYRRIIYILGAIIICNLIACFTAGLLQCTPFAYNWDTSIPGGSCFNRVAYFEFASLANIITDIAMLVLPLRIVWHLQTDRATKLGLSTIFLTGGIGLVTSIVRFTAFSAENVFTDISYATVNLTIFTIVEPGSYLIASCLPTYRALYLYCVNRDPNASATPAPYPVSASSARKARIWLDRVLERSGMKRSEADTTFGADTVAFTRPTGSAYSAHTEIGIPSSEQQSADGHSAQEIRVEHELVVYSSPSAIHKNTIGWVEES